LLLWADDDPQPLVPGAGPGEDPLAFDAGEREAFERRAAAGLSHVLYARSPGGAAATARRTARWRPEIDAAAAEADLDADLLEALVFLESAGRPDVVAGPDVAAAAGLTQILAQTAVDFLEMRVDLPRSRALTRRIRLAERRGRTRRARSLRAARRRVDERFDPEKALAATGRYLTNGRERFGREDLALASYHMGIGNLERALRAYADESRGRIAGVVAEHDLSYARLYFDSTPLRQERAQRFLASLGDDSQTYLWRVLAAREIMRLYREDPGELARLAALHVRKASAEEVLHPRAETEVFEGPDDVRAARDAGELRALPDDPERFHFAIDPQMGELAARFGEDPELYRGLRPEALGLLVYLAAGVQEASGESPLTVTSTTRDLRYQRLLRSSNPEATHRYSLHTTGYTFDVLREYQSRKQAVAFQFWLDRLQAMNLITWVREPAAIHITVSDEAERLLGVIGRVE
jgi:hypothetical protein